MLTPWGHSPARRSDRCQSSILFGIKMVHEATLFGHMTPCRRGMRYYEKPFTAFVRFRRYSVRGVWAAYWDETQGGPRDDRRERVPHTHAVVDLSYQVCGLVSDRRLTAVPATSRTKAGGDSQ